MLSIRIICILIGYAFGLFQTGFFIGKLHKIDIRDQGSGNSGSTNALRVLGWQAGLFTFLGDILKCVFAVLLVHHIYQGQVDVLTLGMYAALGVTLGHNYPFYLKFKGGKGIAVMAGIIIITAMFTNLWVFFIPLFVFVSAVYLTRFVSLGSLQVSMMFFLLMIMYGALGKFTMPLHSIIELNVVVFILMVLAWVRHAENIKRLAKGEENRIDKKNREA